MTRPAPIDYDEVEKLYDSGLNDREISEIVKCSCLSVFKWRKQNGLLPNKKRYKDDVVCDILRKHKNDLEHDENRLSTEFINTIIATRCDDYRDDGD